jgi:glutamine amidotransferase
MQVLLTDSEEFGLSPGLAIIAGRVRRFADALPGQSPRLKVPHMGWNQLRLLRPCPLLEGIPDGAFTYFVHSYYAVPTASDVVVASTDYGIDFASVLWRDNIYATQFHPEKSQAYGLRLLRNFAALS